MAAAAVALIAAQQAPACGAPEAWPHYQRYLERFVTAGGRVVDLTAGGRSTSEGQAYALFHALVAGDRARFEQVLAWTRDNLAGGDLERKLPAWLWGKGRDGAFRVLDKNAASDADLWLGYALLEAGRLWSRPEWDALGRRVLVNVRQREIADLPGLGPTLLPGPIGFVLEDGGAHRLNPSYLPVQVLRRIAGSGLRGPWPQLIASSARVLIESARAGFAPDWILVRGGRFVDDGPQRARAGYDAIRVPLWAGMLDPQDPLRERLQAALPGLLREFRARGSVPESVELRRGRASANDAPPGFLAALLPLAIATGDEPARAGLLRQLEVARAAGLYGQPPTYYDQNLVLFGLGFAERRFRFAPDGSLVPRWAEPCAR